MAIQYGATPKSAESTTRLQRLFIARLNRLVHLEATPNRDVDTAQLLRRAIYSTYIDCRELGLGDQARSIIRPSNDTTGAALT